MIRGPSCEIHSGQKLHSDEISHRSTVHCYSINNFCSIFVLKIQQQFG